MSVIWLHALSFLAGVLTTRAIAPRPSVANFPGRPYRMNLVTRRALGDVRFDVDLQGQGIDFLAWAEH